MCGERVEERQLERMAQSAHWAGRYQKDTDMPAPVPNRVKNIQLRRYKHSPHVVYITSSVLPEERLK